MFRFQANVKSKTCQIIPFTKIVDNYINIIFCLNFKKSFWKTGQL